MIQAGGLAAAVRPVFPLLDRLSVCIAFIAAAASGKITYLIFPDFR